MFRDKVVERCLDRLAKQHGDLLYKLTEILSLVKQDAVKELAELDGRIRAMFMGFCERHPEIMEGFEHIHAPLPWLFEHLMALNQKRFYEIQALREEINNLRYEELK